MHVNVKIHALEKVFFFFFFLPGFLFTKWLLASKMEKIENRCLRVHLQVFSQPNLQNVLPIVKSFDFITCYQRLFGSFPQVYIVLFPPFVGIMVKKKKKRVILLRVVMLLKIVFSIKKWSCNSSYGSVLENQEVLILVFYSMPRFHSHTAQLA